MAQKTDSDQAGKVNAGDVSRPGDPSAALGEKHPLARLAGSYKDDPFWDEFIQAMKDARKADDEDLEKYLSDVRS